MLKQYLDRQDFKWKSKRTQNFRLYFEPRSETGKHVNELRRNVEEDRAVVLRILGEPRYDPTIYAFLLNSGDRMKDLVGVYVHGRSRPLQHAVFSVVTEDRLHLTHEICHEIASNLWGPAEHWIEEGLATYAQEGSNVYFDSWDLLNTRSMLPLDKLVDPEWRTTMYAPEITYPQLGGFVKFLYDRYGVERVKRLWAGGSRSIPAVLGKQLPELEREWHESLVTQFPSRPTRHYRSGLLGFFIE